MCSCSDNNKVPPVIIYSSLIRPESETHKVTYCSTQAQAPHGVSLDGKIRGKNRFSHLLYYVDCRLDTYFSKFSILFNLDLMPCTFELLVHPIKIHK